ncbi:MAG: acetyl-CoA carboxylase biotin carboxyl carrier protein [Candidatus Hydrogenedentota bacterium]
MKELKELIAVFENSDLTELELEEDGHRMRLQKNIAGGAAVPMYIPQAPAVTGEVSTPKAVTSTPPDEPEEETYANTINSPMVGTFYAAPSPGEPLFVQEGDQIAVGQTICIVEAMKLMNEVSAKSNCIIEKILVENAQPVEFGQPLFAIRNIA